MSTRGYCCPSFGNAAPPSLHLTLGRGLKQMWALIGWKRAVWMKTVASSCTSHRSACISSASCVQPQVQLLTLPWRKCRKKDEIQMMQPVHVWSSQRKEHLSLFFFSLVKLSYQSHPTRVPGIAGKVSTVSWIMTVWLMATWTNLAGMTHICVHAHSTCTHTHSRARTLVWNPW